MSKRIGARYYNVRIVERASGLVEVIFVHVFRERKSGGGWASIGHGEFTSRLIRAAKAGKLFAIKCEGKA